MLLKSPTPLATRSGDDSPSQLCGGVREHVVRRIRGERRTESTDEIENRAATRIRFCRDTGIRENLLKALSGHN